MTMSLELVREFESFHSADRHFVNYRNALISALSCDRLITAGARDHRFQVSGMRLSFPESEN